MLQDEYVSTRMIGDASVTAINEGSGQLEVDLTAAPGTPEPSVPDARLPIGFHVFHIAVAGASILVDSGFDDPLSSWGVTFDREWPSVTRTPGLTEGLATIGVRPEAITHVLITHAHFDHIAGLTREESGQHVPRFPNADVYLGTGDWSMGEEHDPSSDAAVRLGTIERHGHLRLIEAETEIVPGVTMMPAPGESDGHCIVRVSSSGEACFLVGDLYHHACEVEHPEWSSPWVEKAKMAASREMLVSEAVPAGALVAFTHHQFPPWGAVQRTSQGFGWVVWTASQESVK